MKNFWMGLSGTLLAILGLALLHHAINLKTLGWKGILAILLLQIGSAIASKADEK